MRPPLQADRHYGAMYVLLIGTLAALSMFGAEAVPFRIYETFQNEPSQQVRESIREEADTIIAPTGWAFVWRPLDSAPGEVSVRLAVLTFTGTCSTLNLPTPLPFRSVLGATQISDGNLLPFADIHCDAIRAMLTPGLSKLDPRRRDTVFGRAVGRVVAHELYHIFGNTLDHAPKGVGEANYSPGDLLSDGFRFQPHEVKVLRNKLLPALLEYDDWLRDSTTRPGYSVFVKSGCYGCHGFRGEGTQWGPQLQDAGRVYDAARLSAHLKNGKSEMKRRAEELNLMWPRLSTADVKALAAFLQRLFEDSTLRAN